MRGDLRCALKDESPYPKMVSQQALLRRGGHPLVAKCTLCPQAFKHVALSSRVALKLRLWIVLCAIVAAAQFGHRERKHCVCSGLKVTRCGGYGSLYCTFGAQIIVRRSTVTRGKYGIMALHEGSRMDCVDSEFAYNLWSGIASRWSGCGSVTRCRVHHNGANGFQIRKSCASGVIVKDSFDHDNHVDPLYAFKHRDLHCTEVARRASLEESVPQKLRASSLAESREKQRKKQRNRERIERKQKE